MAVKKNQRGKVIGNHEFIEICETRTYEGYGNKRRAKSSNIGLFVTKHKLQDNFINKELALEYAKLVLPTYDKRKKTIVKPKIDDNIFFKVKKSNIIIK